jgi:DNA-binding winged helix-turn-helix (wHTH) protein/predicted ATPase
VGQGVFRFGDCELDEPRRELRRNGELQRLEPQVFDVLVHLVRHRDRVVAKTELLDEIWGSRFVGESALVSRIRSARQAIGDNGREQTVIRTVHGRGYRFVAAVDQPAPAAQVVSARPDRPDVPGLVGRSWALDRLEKRFTEAATGSRRTVFVLGEAGIGKTALIDAFVERLDPRRVLVVRGGCPEPRGPTEPYLPVFDALGRACRGPGGDQVRDVLSTAAPSWLLQMPSLVPADRLVELRARSMGASSQRMMRELVDAVELLAADRPLVVMLDDLHWSDGPTTTLVDWLARRTDPARLQLIGTFRPGHATSDGVGAAARGLVVAGLAEQLTLQRLNDHDVARLLEEWLPGLPASMATVVHARTAGVPLFVRDLVSSWIDAGVLTPARPGQWIVDGEAEQLARTVPASVQLMVEQDLARLAPDDVAVLEGAAVVGPAFPCAAVAAATGQPEEDVETRCAALARRGLLVGSDGIQTWADGSGSARFRFLHQLHVEDLYGRVSPRRRARYHTAIGRCLERAHGTHVNEHVGELATHFDRGTDPSRATEYLRRAAEQAIVRGAYADALDHLDAAVRHAARISEADARARSEIALQLQRVSALIVTRGWAASEIDAAYRRAWELCQGLGDAPERRIVRVGLAAVQEMRGRHVESETLLQRELETGPGVLALETYELLACSTFHQGRFAKAIDHAVRGLTHYRPDAPNEEYARHGVDPAVFCHGWAAFASFFLGRRDEAQRHIQQAHAAIYGHPSAATTASLAATFLHQFDDDPAETWRSADTATALASEHGYPFRLAQAHILRGWAAAASRTTDDGLTELRDGLHMYRASGAFIELPYYLGLLADALLRTGKPDEALISLTDALAALDGTDSYYFEPELHRLRAIALLTASPANALQEAAAAIERGLELARAQRSTTAHQRLLDTKKSIHLRRRRG